MVALVTAYQAEIKAKSQIQSGLTISRRQSHSNTLWDGLLADRTVLD